MSDIPFDSADILIVEYEIKNKTESPNKKSIFKNLNMIY